MKQHETEVFHKLRVATPLSSRTGNPVSVVFNGVSANSWLSPIGISHNRKLEDKGDHNVLPQRPQSTGSIAIIRHHPKPSGLKRNETIVGRHLLRKSEEIDTHSTEGCHAVTDAFRRPVPFEGDYREGVESLLYKQRLVKKGYRGGGFCDGHARKPRPYTSRPYQFRTVEQPISLELTVKSLELSRDRHSDAKRNRFPEEELERREHQGRNVDAFRDLSRTCMRRAQSAPPASRENQGKQKPSLYWRARSAYHRKLMTPQPDPECVPSESNQVVRGSMLRPLMYNGSTDIQHSAGCPYKCKGCFKACLVSADYLENAKSRRQPVKATRDFRYRTLMKKDPRFVLHQALARNQPIYKLVHGYCDKQSVQEAWDDGATIRGHTDDSDNLTQLSVLGDNGASTNCDTREDLTLEDDDTSSQDYTTVEDEDVDASFLQPRTLRTEDCKPMYQSEDTCKEGSQGDKRKQRLFLRDGAKSAEQRRRESLIKLNARSKSFSEAAKNSDSILEHDTNLMGNLQEECVVALSSKEEDTAEDEYSCTPEHNLSNIDVRAQDCESICDSISEVNSAIMDVSRLFCSSVSSEDIKMSDSESSKDDTSSEVNRASETGSNDSQDTLHEDSGVSGDDSVESDTVSNSVETHSDNTAQSDSTNSESPDNRHRRNNRNRNRKRTGSSIKSAKKEAASSSESVNSDTISGRSDTFVDVSDISDEPDSDSTIPERQQKLKRGSKSVGRKVSRDTKRKPSKGKNRRVSGGSDKGKPQLKPVRSVDSDMLSGTAHSATESELNFSEDSNEELDNSVSSEGEETLVEQSDSTVHSKESVAKDHSQRTRTRIVKKQSRNLKQQKVKGKSSKVSEKASESSASEESSNEEEDEHDSMGDCSEKEHPNRKPGQSRVSRTSSQDTNSEDTRTESTENSSDDTSNQNQVDHKGSPENKRKKTDVSRKAQGVKTKTNKNMKSSKGMVIPKKRPNTKGRRETKEETPKSDEESCDSEEDDLSNTKEEINDSPKKNRTNNRKSKNIKSNPVEKDHSTRNINKRGKIERHKRIEHNSQSESVQSDEETRADGNSSECSSNVSRGTESPGKCGSDDPEQRDTTDESDTGKQSDKSGGPSETADDESNTEQSEEKSDDESSDGESESENDSDDD